MSDVLYKLTPTVVVQSLFLGPRLTLKKSFLVVKIIIKAPNNSPSGHLPVKNQQQKQWKKLEVNNMMEVNNKDTRTTSKRCETLMSF